MVSGYSIRLQCDHDDGPLILWGEVGTHERTGTPDEAVAKVTEMVRDTLISYPRSHVKVVLTFNEVVF